MVALTAALVRSKARTDDLAQVKSLNAWGQELDDVTALELLPNVEVLSLSISKISSLRPFGRCGALRELYLRKNSVADLAGLCFLARLPNLQVLWLSDNPCAGAPHYRATVIRSLPSLAKLDNTDVTAEERAAAEAAAPLLRPAASDELDEAVSVLESAGLSVAAVAGQLRHDSAAASSSGGGGTGGCASSGAAVACEPTPPTAASPPAACQAASRTSPAAAAGGGASQAGGSSGVQHRNILYAVIALLPELDARELALVAREAERLSLEVE